MCWELSGGQSSQASNLDIHEIGLWPNMDSALILM